MTKSKTNIKREKSRPRAMLREWRTHQGLTLQEVGEIMGVHRSQISNWETGFRSMPEKKLIAYCEAVGIDVAQVYQKPDTQSIDVLMANATPEQREKATKIIKILMDL